jgi:hypothetical protein
MDGSFRRDVIGVCASPEAPGLPPEGPQTFPGYPARVLRSERRRRCQARTQRIAEGTNSPRRIVARADSGSTADENGQPWTKAQSFPAPQLSRRIGTARPHPPGAPRPTSARPGAPSRPDHVRAGEDPGGVRGRPAEGGRVQAAGVHQTSAQAGCPWNKFGPDVSQAARGGPQLTPAGNLPARIRRNLPASSGPRNLPAHTPSQPGCRNTPGDRRGRSGFSGPRYPGDPGLITSDGAN